MKRQIQVSLVWLVAGLTLLTGCTPTQPFFLHEDGDLSHYLDSVQTTAAYPDVETADTPRIERFKRIAFDIAQGGVSTI